MTIALKMSAAEAPEAPLPIDPARIRIGPDVLELVTTAMYVDPRTLFREYIQNAADAIDAARADGLLGAGEGTVTITIDRAARSVRIRDDGTGLPPEGFAETLTALGGSAKRGTAARGFRGVGRLSGLGYARELVFRSRVEGGAVSVLTWDCRKLRGFLRNASDNADLPSLIAACTSAMTEKSGDDETARFFEVEMRGVARLRNDVLLNHDLVRAYIAEVCPVPFADAFGHRERVEAHLRGRIALANLTVTLDNDATPVTRPHRDRIALADGRTVELVDVELIELAGRDGGAAAVGWLAHHAYDGAVPSPMLVRGLRLRHGNVQVGGHDLLTELFKEDRFNAWAVGELHVLDRAVVPNARRDHFEQNAAWSHLANQVLPIARALSDRCRHSSDGRNRRRRFAAALQEAEDSLDDAVSGLQRHSSALARAETAIEQAERAASAPTVPDLREVATERLAPLRARVDALRAEPEPADPYRLAELPEADRALCARLFTLVERHGPEASDWSELLRRIRADLDV